PDGGFCAALSAQPTEACQASRDSTMSESANASVVPFIVGEAGTETPARNPAERLHLAEAVRMAEAIVFASAEPVSNKQLAQRLPDGIDIAAAMAELQQIYARRGVNLIRV